MRRGTAAIAASAIVAICAPLSACGGAGSGPNTLILYNGQHEQTTEKLISAFETKIGIRVTVRNDDEDVLANQIETEGSRSP
jgi:ABC-type glycerol-3-phosphate transport system substrate-binding protein